MSYFAAYIAGYGLITSTAWEQGEHPTRELWAYHLLLEALSFSDHHGPPPEQAPISGINGVRGDAPVVVRQIPYALQVTVPTRPSPWGTDAPKFVPGPVLSLSHSPTQWLRAAYQASVLIGSPEPPDTPPPIGF